MLMLFDNPADYAGLTPAQMEAVVREYNEWAQKMGREGRLCGGEKLMDEGGRVLVRGKSGPKVTDGPFSEAKEVLGGYFMINAESYDEAVEIAMSCPHVKYGASTHVRQVENMGGGGG